jgi:crotonobetainyl-CoA:carnitine CoA-transferase CaiB-like acyl-CoA transferase
VIDAPGGPLIVMGEFKWIWKSIHDRLGVADPTPPGASVAEKVELRQRAWRDFYTGFERREDLLAALDRANLAWGVVTSGAAAVATSPTLAHRGSIVTLADDDGDYTVVRSPERFSAADAGVRGPAPHLDEHRGEILADWLGDTDD